MMRVIRFILKLLLPELSSTFSDKSAHKVSQAAVDDADTAGDVIRIYRGYLSAYLPDWVEKQRYPGLDRVGPAKYRLAEVELWLHEKQRHGLVTGHEIYEYLESTGELVDHLDVRDLLVIQERGIECFRKYFEGKAIFAWKTVVLDPDEGWKVACLGEEGEGELEVAYYSLDLELGPNAPALRW